jgi:hypothetical protein
VYVSNAIANMLLECIILARSCAYYSPLPEHGHSAAPVASEQIVQYYWSSDLLNCCQSADSLDLPKCTVQYDMATQSIAANLAAALLHEERRCHYVSREVMCMLRLREQVL